MDAGDIKALGAPNLSEVLEGGYLRELLGAGKEEASQDKFLMSLSNLLLTSGTPQLLTYKQNKILQIVMCSK